MSTTLKLTPALLRRIVKEEKAKLFSEAKRGKTRVEEISSDAEEVDADGYGTDSSLSNPIDHAKAVGVKNEAVRLEKLLVMEARLIRQLRAIRESKNRARAKIKRNI